MNYFLKYPHNEPILYTFALLDEIYGIVYLAFSSMKRLDTEELKKLTLELKAEISGFGSEGIDRFVSNMKTRGFTPVPSAIAYSTKSTGTTILECVPPLSS